jgi:hypothetical protein
MEETQMKTARTILLGVVVMLLGLTAWAQEFPRWEVAGDYSYARFIPASSSLNGHSLNGGGGSLDVNINNWLGFKMDLQGYTSSTSHFDIVPSTLFPSGAQAAISGNLFTYMFGPQIKIRAHGFHPFVHVLLGGAHSNIYGSAFKTICQPVAGACAFTGAPSGNAFSMALGGGVDIPITHTLSLRPGEIDYFLTDFTNQFANNHQNNFRYSAGLVLNFGHTTY